MIYTEDCRRALRPRRSRRARPRSTSPEDTFHGDRAGSLRDPYGHRWMIVTHIEDMSEAEMQRRTEEAMSS